MSLRRLRVLIEHLPPESATKTAVRNSITPEQMAEATGDYRPDQAPWSGVEMLLASVLDAIRHNTATALAVAGGTPTELEPTPRPGIPPKTQARKGMTDEQRRELDPRLRQQPKES